LTTAKISSKSADIFAWLNRLAAKQGAAIAVHVFLHDHGIGSRRHGGTCKDADGLSWCAVKLVIRSSGLFADDLKF
jgi:hypothetical protein